MIYIYFVSFQKDCCFQNKEVAAGADAVEERKQHIENVCHLLLELGGRGLAGIIPPKLSSLTFTEAGRIRLVGMPWDILPARGCQIIRN